MICSCFHFRHIHRIGLGQGNGGRQYCDCVRRYTNGITALLALRKKRHSRSCTVLCGVIKINDARS